MTWYRPTETRIRTPHHTQISLLSLSARANRDFHCVPYNAMFHVMRNTTLYGTNDLIDRFMSALQDLGPRNSLNEISLANIRQWKGSDATVHWRVAGESFSLALDVKVSPIGPLSSSDPSARSLDSEIPVVLSPFISRAARTQLENQGHSYWDATGNLLLQSRRPFMWIRQEGAAKDPDAEAKPTTLQSLKGRSASEVIVRLLANRRAATVRDLARESGVALGTVSRVISLLRSEDFFEPTGGGPIIVTDPLRLARRWANDYSFEKTFKAGRYFSILGSSVALERIRESDANYAITGLAAQALWYEQSARIAPLPTSDLWLYTDDVERIEKFADLVPDNASGNILVAHTDFFEPGRENYRPVGNTRTAWPWRVVGDLLSLSGRPAAAGWDFAEELVSQPMSPYA